MLTLPLLHTLAAAFPSASLDFYVRKGFGSLFVGQPGLGAVYEYDKRTQRVHCLQKRPQHDSGAGERSDLGQGLEHGTGLFATGTGLFAKGTGLFATGRILAAQGYDVWVSAHTSHRSALVARLGGAPVRVGYTGGVLQRLCYTHCVDRRFYALHEVDRLLQLTAPLFALYGVSALAPALHGVAPLNYQHASCGAGTSGCPPVLSSVLPSVLPQLPILPSLHSSGVPSVVPSVVSPLVLPQAGQVVAKAFWQSLPRGHGPCLGLHPGSVWGTKRWTPSGFALVARRAAEAGAHVLVFAGPGEEAVAKEVIELAGLNGHPLLHDLAGRLSLMDLAAFLGRLDCYVSNDSGPLHLAWMQGTPVTALFGPTVHKLGFFPGGAKSMVFEVPLPCRPCGLHGPQTCPLGHHACMTSIDVEAVWKDVEGKLFA